MVARSLRALAFGVAFAGFTGCGASHQDGQAGAGAARPATAVDVAPAAVRTIASYRVFDGQVAPSLASQLSLQQAGTITEVDVKEGDRVAQGQVLARIDASVLQAQLEQNRAQVAQADAKLQGSTLTTPINQEQVRSSLVAAQQQLAQAHNAEATAAAALREAAINYKADSRLILQGYVSQTQLESARSAYVADQQAVSNARAGVEQATAALASAKRNLGQVGVQAQDVSANRGALGAARAQVRLLATQVDQTTLRAPFAGVVTARLLDPGAYAGPNQPIIKLSSIDPVYVNFDVPDDQLDLVRSGTKVSFTTSSRADHRFDGTVDEVNAVPNNGTLEYRARVIEPNPGDVLRGGMLVSVAVRRYYAHDALVVPRSAVGRTPAGATNIFVVEGKTARAIPVKVLFQDDTLAQLPRGTIRPGALVVRVRPDALADGAAVAVTSRTDLPATSPAPPSGPQRVGAAAQGDSSQ